MKDTKEVLEFRGLIERSSLGTDGASRLRARTPQARVELIAEIVAQREKLAACRAQQDRRGMLDAVVGLAAAYHTLGRDDEALTLVPMARIYRQAKLTDRIWWLTARASVCSAIGRVAEAEALFSEVHELHRDLETQSRVSESSPDLDMTPPVQQVLRALLEEPSHEIDGLEICTRAELPSGTIHPILARLERLGWLESRWEETDHSRPEEAPRRRLYRFNHDGAASARLALAQATASASGVSALHLRPAGGRA